MGFGLGLLTETAQMVPSGEIAAAQHRPLPVGLKSHGGLHVDALYP